MNKKTEEEAVEAFQRRVFSPFLAAVSRLSACPFIWLKWLRFLSNCTSSFEHSLWNDCKHTPAAWYTQVHAYSHTHSPPEAPKHTVLSVLDRNRPMSQPVCVCVCVCVRVRMCTRVWVQIATDSQCRSNVSSIFFSKFDRFIHASYHHSKNVCVFPSYTPIKLKTKLEKQRSLAARQWHTQ